MESFERDTMHEPIRFETPTTRREAFSGYSRDSIRQRAYNLETGRYESEISGDYNRPFERAHLNHDKNKKLYNHPSNGVYVTDIEHLAHHLMHKYYPEQIGLTMTANLWAIDQIERRVLKFNKRNGYHINLEKALDKAKRNWSAFFEG